MGKREELNDNEYLDTSTGEIIQKRGSDGKHFVKFFWDGMEAFESLFGFKMHLFTYMLRKMNKNNIVSKTQQQMADDVGISRRYANELLRAYEDNKLIISKRNYYMVNPHYFFNGRGELQGRAINIYTNIIEGNLRKQLKDEGYE